MFIQYGQTLKKVTCPFWHFYLDRDIGSILDCIPNLNLNLTYSFSSFFDFVT